MLTPGELEQLAGGETLFPSPIPVQFVSSDEYMPSPQSARQKAFEARIKEMGATLAKKHDMTRRRFFKTAAGMAAAFVAMNEVHAKKGEPLYRVEKSEHLDLHVAQARADSLKNQFVMDMHTHFLREGTPIKTFIAQRETVGRAGWNPTLKEKPQTIEDLMFPNYFKEVFLDSDTKSKCPFRLDDEKVMYPFYTTPAIAGSPARAARRPGTSCSARGASTGSPTSPRFPPGTASTTSTPTSGRSSPTATWPSRASRPTCSAA